VELEDEPEVLTVAKLQEARKYMEHSCEPITVADLRERLGGPGPKVFTTQRELNLVRRLNRARLKFQKV
jgi:hypothetical protein